MAGQPGFFDLSDRYEALSAAGDPLERLSAVVDFEVFRGPLVAALRRSVRGKGGRPPFDPVLMFKILVLQALYSLSDEATEFQIKDRLSFQRFLGLGLEGSRATDWRRLSSQRTLSFASIGIRVRLIFRSSWAVPLNLSRFQNLTAARPRGSPSSVTTKLECISIPHTA